MSEKMLLLLGAAAVALFFVFSRSGNSSLVGGTPYPAGYPTANNGAGLIGLENGFSSLLSGLSGAVGAGTSGAPASSGAPYSTSLPASAAFAGSTGAQTTATPGSISNLGSAGLINSNLLFQNTLETGTLNSTPNSSLLPAPPVVLAPTQSVDFSFLGGSPSSPTLNAGTSLDLSDSDFSI